jgi:5-methylcytosine-specific restriction protein A
MCVAELVKRRANGYCQLCVRPAPFKTANGEPYLESHHIIWLPEGGQDSIDNIVAPCPNCHRKMHMLNMGTDVQHLKTVASVVETQ